ncbi:hypothetical protein KI387_026248, partial [Taxus chinensis]
LNRLVKYVKSPGQSNTSKGLLLKPKDTPPQNNTAVVKPSPSSERVEPFYVSLLLNGFKLSNCILDS